ncbi:SecA DEAD-like domain-containing protein [Roseovarius marisflavi]|uniref:SecA DEAD-like domain-containing protein n=1 Tax=Roseovarius marisflavi TaxID=1054996 RepID=A0A1M7CK20_9RHOB|nr:hypothetical protein [Roseovarius marisflavi]SHL67179.1 SecA DEAD-like domain-containing protein [Roseovarius marisflavi]
MSTAQAPDRGRLAAHPAPARQRKTEGSPLDQFGARLWVRLWPVWRPVAHLGLWLVALRARALSDSGPRGGEVACLARAVIAAQGRFRLSEMCRALAMARGWAVAERDPQRRKKLILLAGLILAQRPSGVRISLAHGGDIAQEGARLAPAFARLGVPLAVIEDGTPLDERQKRLIARATLCSLKSLGHDYLRDAILLGEGASGLRLATRDLRGKTRVGGGWRRNPAVLLADLDRALLDDARLPMTAGGARDQLFTATEARAALDLARSLQEGEDFRLGPPGQPPTLSALGRKRLAAAPAQARGLSDDPTRRTYLVTLAVMALHGVKRGRDYVLGQGVIEIIDPETGQPAPGRNWGSGVQQMIEALERVPMTPVQRSLAQISVPGVLAAVPLLGGVASDLDNAGRELHLRYGLRPWPGRAPVAPGPIVFCRDRAAQEARIDALLAEGAVVVSDSPERPDVLRIETALAGISPVPDRIVLADVAETARLPRALSDRNGGCPVSQIICFHESPFAGRLGPRILLILWSVSPLRQLRARLYLVAYQNKMARQFAKQRAAQVDVEARRKRILAFSGRGI